MKNLLCLCIVALLSMRAAASPPPDYGAYHRAVLHAEHLFLNKVFPAAFAQYKAAFTDYPRPFAKDCFVALQLACWQRDTTYADYFFQKAFENGINREMTGMAGHINTYLRRSDAYERRIDSLYKACRPRYLNALNLDQRFEVEALLKKDGLYHEMPAEYATLKVRDSLYGRVVDANVLALAAMIRRHGLPGEKTAGIQDAKLDDLHAPQYWMRMTALATHIFHHQPWAAQLLRSELLQAVRDGELHPRSYALIYEWSYCWLVEGQRWKSSADSRVPMKVKAALSPQDKHYNVVPRFHPEHQYYSDTAQVNGWRAEIGIASLQHDERKKEFAKRWNLILTFGAFQTD